MNANTQTNVPLCKGDEVLLAIPEEWRWYGAMLAMRQSNMVPGERYSDGARSWVNFYENHGGESLKAEYEKGHQP